jgi:hypothetical protein
MSPHQRFRKWWRGRIVEGCSLWDVVINGVIGAPKLLSIEHPHGIAGRLGPRVFRTFVSLGALALCALVLAFAEEEAQAQQLPQAQHVATGEQVAGNISQTPVEAAPTEETSPRETHLARTPPIEPASQPALVWLVSTAEEVSSAASDPALAEPKLPVGDALPDLESASGSAIRSDPVSGSTTVPAEQDGPKIPVDPYLTLPDPRPTTSERATEASPGLVSAAPGDQGTAPGPVDPDRSPLDPEPEPVAVKESNPLPLLTGEAPAAEPAALYAGEEEGSYLPYVPVTSVVGAVETLDVNLGNAAAYALGVLVDEALSWPAPVEGEGLVDTTLAGLFNGEAAGHAPASEPSGETESSPTGTAPEWPLQDSGPQPVSPFTPPAGSSFSLSGGQVGAGIVALLLCVLASGLLLLRREYKLFWAFCELPKPSSVLLLPPERPG